MTLELLFKLSPFDDTFLSGEKLSSFGGGSSVRIMISEGEKMRLRPYKPCDAAKIIEWCKDKETYDLWGGFIIGDYPITEEILNDVYINHNGRCTELDNFYPMTAIDDNEEMVGHFIMRYINGDKKKLRFGWVIVDADKRGQHIGQNMLKLGLKYAFEILGVDKVTLGVFENNTPAYKCYLSTGFHKPSELPDKYEEINGEKWLVVELEIKKDDNY